MDDAKELAMKTHALVLLALLGCDERHTEAAKPQRFEDAGAVWTPRREPYCGTRVETLEAARKLFESYADFEALLLDSGPMAVSACRRADAGQRAHLIYDPCGRDITVDCASMRVCRFQKFSEGGEEYCQRIPVHGGFGFYGDKRRDASVNDSGP